MDRKGSKENEQFNRQLNQLLTAFERNKEWADIGNWLQKIENLLIEYKDPIIKEKITLGKRLSQCLNPILPPGTHLQALKVYELLFSNMALDKYQDVCKNPDFVFRYSEDLGIYSSGLFPFFQYASSQVKPKILQILKMYYFPLGIELIPCMPGLVMSILPGLDEQNEALQKSVLEALRVAGECVGTKYLLGAIWMAILRTPKNRYTGLKYLSKVIPKKKGADDDDDDDDYNDDDEDEDGEESVSAYEDESVLKSAKPPKIIDIHKQHLESSDRIDFEETKKKLEENEINLAASRGVPATDNNLSSFIVTEEDVDRTLDISATDNVAAANKKAKLKKEILEENKEKQDDDKAHFPNRSTLVINAILACLEDESPIVQKAVLEFMYSHLKLSNTELFNIDDKQVLVEAVLYLLIKRENAHDRRIYDWLFGKPNMNNQYDIQNEVFDLLMDAMMKIFKTAPANKNAIPLKILQKLFYTNESIVENTLKKLSLKIMHYMYKYYQGYEFSINFAQQCSNFFENIRSHFPLILKTFFPPLEAALALEDFEIKKTPLRKILEEKTEKKCLKIIKLIQFTFNEFFIKKEKDSWKVTAASEYMIMNILKVFRLCITEKERLLSKFVRQAIQLCLNLNECMEKVILESKSNKHEENEDNVSDKNKENIMEESFHQLENSGVDMMSFYRNELTEDNATILKGFSEVYGVIVGFHKKKNFENNNDVVEVLSLASKILVKAQKFLRTDNKEKLPVWFYLIVDCLSLNNQNVSIIAIETIIDILNLSNEDTPRNIYKDLKTLIIEDSENREYDYVKLIIENLWTFLDYNASQKKIVELILDFQKYFREIFRQVIYISLTNSKVDPEIAIRRFAAYWKLTNEEEFIKQVIPVNNALFLMLDFLDHENPLIRHTSKSWLMDSKNKLDRIIDPIFETLIKFKFEENEDPKIITEMLRRLKTILTANEEALMYMDNEISPFILDVGSTDEALKQHNYYIDLLAVLCLKFIEGPDMKKEGSSVNANTCEFLFLVINLLDAKISHRICSKIIEPLLNVLDTSIDNKVVVMQVQVMNLLNVILFHSGYLSLDQIYRDEKEKDRKKKEIAVILQKNFVTCLLKGLGNQSSYIKHQYSNLIKESITIISNFLIAIDQDHLRDSIKDILNKYYDSIIELKPDNEGEEWNEDIDVFIIDPEEKKKKAFKRSNQTQIMDKSTVFGNSSVDKARGINDTEGAIVWRNAKSKNNNPFAESQQNQNMIFVVLDAIKSILNFFLKFMMEDKANKAIPEINQDEDEADSPSFMGKFKEVITFGLFNAVKKEKKEISDKYPNIIKFLQEDLKKTVEIFIHCWNISESFFDHIIKNDLSNAGVRPYEFENYNSFNKFLTGDKNNPGERQKFFDKQGKPKKVLKTVKSQIISILHNLTFDFITEMMDAYLSIWLDYNIKSIEGPEKEQLYKTKMSKLIETLIMLNIPEKVFLKSLVGCTKKALAEFKTGEQKTKNKNEFILDYELALKESRILYFFYVYFAYTYIDPDEKKREPLLVIWTELIKFLNIFENSKNPNTLFWIIEIIHLFSKRYWPEEVLNDPGLQKSLQNITNDLFTKVASISADKYKLIFNKMPEMSAKDKKAKKTSIVQTEKYDIVLPYPPTIYQMKNAYREKSKKEEEETSDFSKNEKSKKKEEKKETFDVEKEICMKRENPSIDELSKVYRLMGFKILNIFAMIILKKTHPAQKVERIVERTRAFMDIILPIMDDHAPDKQIYVECASELLETLFSNNKEDIIMIKEYKKPVLDIFNNTEFFNCSKKTLKYWGKIIDTLINRDKSDLFTEFLKGYEIIIKNPLKILGFSVSLFNGFFNPDADTRKRIKNFERICFVIYSGAKGNYESKLNFLLEKIKDLIKNPDTASPPLLILILFCMRILILRLSPKALNSLLKTLWPMILSILIQILLKSKPSPQKDKKEQAEIMNLILAALKLIELISILQFEEFYLHQWIFVFDYFGLKLEKNYSATPMNLPKKMLTPFDFEPFIMKFLPNNYMINYRPLPNDIEEKKEEINEKEKPEKKKEDRYLKKKRELIVTDPKIDDFPTLKERALELCNYLIENNEMRAEPEDSQIENLIEEDFINMDAYISLHKA